MRVSTDGGFTWVEVDEVRIEPDTRDLPYTFTMTCTSEGVIKDWWSRGVDEECVRTDSSMWEDIHGEGA